VRIFDRRECFSIWGEAGHHARVLPIQGLTGATYCDFPW
jgi:hypothetical protein